MRNPLWIVVYVPVRLRLCTSLPRDMSMLTDDSDDDSKYVFIADISNIKNIVQLLKAVHFREAATIFASANGLKVTVEDCKCIQGSAFIQSDIFVNYVIREDPLTFRVNLKVLMECLTIFRNTEMPASNTPLRVCYEGYGFPLILSLDEADAVTNCSIQTQEPDEVLDFDFGNSNVISKIIMKSDALKEAFTELDANDDIVQLTLSPDCPYFTFSVIGNSTSFHMDCPKDSEMVEMFQCSQTQTNRYRSSLLKHASKALNQSNKVSIRTDDRGFLCLQFMIVTEDGKMTFVEYFCSPDEDIDEDDDH